ncbi:MAG: sporulation protein YunB [Ruminococcus sp.]|nr:sporulation protein YunB [Ruminococcus sp.]MDD6530740.1 sporulation protein YunB [Ruminococcus sp.]
MLIKKIKKKRKFMKFIVIFIVISILIIIAFESYMKPLQDKIMENEARGLVEERVSKIADDVISNSDYDYDKLLVKSENKNGGIVSLSVNTPAVNKIQNEFSDVFQNKMDDLNTQYFSVPLGDLTNLSMLSSLGPRIKFSYDMTGSVDVELKSTFESTGVNQTIHRVNMIVDAEVVFISQSYMENLKIRNEFAISETVIVGDTPDYLYPKVN